MRDYIFEKVKNTSKKFKVGGVPVKEIDELPENFNLDSVLNALEKYLPSYYFDGLESITIKHLDEFDERDVVAVYRDSEFIITNKQENTKDLLDDLIHEFAHHLETKQYDLIYADEKIKKEFLKKRAELEFELRSEGYWTQEYQFSNIEYDKDFDNFLYKRVGRNMLKLITSGMFIRPYAAVSLREYFATGFEAYYLGKKEKLDQISPVLYNRVNELNNLTRK